MTGLVVSSGASIDKHDFQPRTMGSAWLGPSEETCHWCGCDPRNAVHQPELALCSGVSDGQQCVLPLGHESPCCMAPRHATPEPVVTDEVLQARVAALVASLRAVMRLVDKGAFVWPRDQETIWTAESLLAEGWDR